MSSLTEYEEHRRQSHAKHPDVEALYVCPQAVDPKSLIFIDFNWDDFYDGENTDFEDLRNYFFDQLEWKTKDRKRPGPRRRKVCTTIMRAKSRYKRILFQQTKRKKKKTRGEKKKKKTMNSMY